MSQQPKDRPFTPNDPKNPKKPKKPLGLIRKPKPGKLPSRLADSVIPLTRVIFERSKNVRRKQAALANKIDRRGGPKNAAEAGVVGRENARQEGLAGNKEHGRKAKRGMQNSNTAYPLTADRVFMFEGNKNRRTPGTGPHVPASDRPGFAKKIMKDKMRGKRPQTPEKKPVKPGNVKRRDGSSVTTDEFGGKTEWGR